MSERAAAVPDENSLRGVCVYRVLNLVSNAANNVRARGGFARLVRNRRAAEFEEEEVVQTEFYLGDNLWLYSERS